MCEAVSITHSLALALAGQKHNKPTNKKAANHSNSPQRAQLMRASHGNNSYSPAIMSPSYLDTKVKSGYYFSHQPR